MKTRALSTRVFEAGRARIEIDAAELRIVSGPDRGVRMPLEASSIRIGTARECELVLHDPTVSARHAEIASTRRGYVVRDLGSKNGVRIGAVQVERAPLAAGQRIHIGETAIAIKALGGTRDVPLARPGQFGRVIAQSLRMRAVVATLEQLAGADATILLEGETGTGKEVAAESIHAASPRARGPFVVMDCGAVSPSLVASELFGHAAGAFSGADRDRPGLFESADGGTLFLDEVGELPLELQPTLLRSLDKKTARRIGTSRDIPYDVRVVAATNRNLSEEVRAGRFRQDLYYRLAVARVQLPPLRERPEDIPVLARTFASEVGLAMSPELLSVLTAHDWPGNVRELRNTVERAAASGLPVELGKQRAGSPVSRRLFLDGEDMLPLPAARQRATDAFERAYVEEVLTRAGGNVSRAAELAGVSRQMMTRLTAKHGLRASDRDG